MGHELRYLCLVETRRLLLLMGVVFGIILFVQYFELPYSNIFSSLFASGKYGVTPIETFPNQSSYSNHTISTNLTNSMPSNVADVTNSSTINSTDLNVADVVSIPVNFSEGTNVKNSDDISSEEIDPEDEPRSSDFSEMNHTSTSESILTNYSSTSDYTPKSNASVEYNGERDDVVAKSDKIEEKSSSDNLKSHSPGTSMGKDTESIHQQNRKTKILSRPEPAVVSISMMNDVLLKSHVSKSAMIPQWSSIVDEELLKAKSLIQNAAVIRKDPHFDVHLFRNFSEFKRSYELMEQTLKVYIYAEGERPIFHQPPLKGIYASEGWFMKLLQSNKQFVTKNPKKAHLFYLPFSSRSLEITLYEPNSHSRKNMIEFLSNYIGTISSKYNFWNRTGGADHFLVACHDWAPAETRDIMSNCIRAMCNADVREGFKFGKDVSLPETYVRSPQNPLRQLGGKPPSQRKFLAFFAGSMHGYLRPILLNYWENKDPDMKIFGKIRKKKGEITYAQYMKTSKYCICAKGYEVNSPRVVEAIFYECVPVIISDNFVPPFFETLNWESFAVFVLEKDIPNLKKILSSISKKRYTKMQQRVKSVQQHFLWHMRPVKYDIFHMILHSIWYNRVFQTREQPGYRSHRLWSSIETRRWLWILGISFATTVLAFQFFKLPTDTVFSSLITAGKVAFFGSTKDTTHPIQKSNNTKNASTNLTSNSSSAMSISQMDELLSQSHSSLNSKQSHIFSAVDKELLHVKSEIENAPLLHYNSELYEPLYRNVSKFKRSYDLMDKMLKVYIYKEGEKPIFHESILEGIYASEGWFLKLMESSKHFVTEDHTKAHLFYLPFSSRLLQLTLYVRHSHSRENLIIFMKNYTELLIHKYPFWNRTNGEDHFLTACHDWAPAETRGKLLNCLRALCNADMKVGFVIGKDVSLPTVNVRSAKNPIKNIGGEPFSNRSTLAFFAGYMHGSARPMLLKYWGNDSDMSILDRMPHIKGKKNYNEYMKSSKYCICARGYAVHSPRVVESIFFECVPVIISDNYIPPFFEVLNWKSFAVFILEKDIPDLKNILMSISDEKYFEMQKGVKEVQKHFIWHDEPVKYDMFHMILHSVWYNRVFRQKSA